MTRPHVTLGTVLRVIAVVLALSLFVVYVLWQSRIFITGPTITLAETPPATTTNAAVTIAGRAEHIVWIRLNGRAIVTTPQGEFKETITLPPGYTIVELSAADRFGRMEALHFPVVRISASNTEVITD